MESFILYAISDSIRETAQQVAKAAISQFDIREETYDIKRFPYVSNKDILLEILENAKKENAIIVYTLVRKTRLKARRTQRENISNKLCEP